MTRGYDILQTLFVGMAGITNHAESKKYTFIYINAIYKRHFKKGNKNNSKHVFAPMLIAAVF
jgi:hypothetical protein